MKFRSIEIRVERPGLSHRTRRYILVTSVYLLELSNIDWKIRQRGAIIELLLYYSGEFLKYFYSGITLR